MFVLLNSLLCRLFFFTNQRGGHVIGSSPCAFFDAEKAISVTSIATGLQKGEIFGGGSIRMMTGLSCLTIAIVYKQRMAINPFSLRQA